MKRLVVEQPASMGIGIGLVILLLFAGIARDSFPLNGYDTVEHTHQVISDFDALRTNFDQAENQQWGYLLTGEQDFLKQRDAALTSVAIMYTALKTLTRDNSSQQQRLHQIQAGITDTTRLFTDSQMMYAAHGFKAAQPLFAQARAAATNASTLVAEATQAENVLLKQRKDSETLSLKVVLVGVLLLLVLLGLQAIRTRRAVGAREAADQAGQALLQTGALQDAIFNSPNFSSIATDAKGVIQIFNVGAERMLGYTAAEVVDKITPAGISDAQEIIARAAALTEEFSTQIAPGFDALVFKAMRGIEDIYELTYIRKDGSRFPAIVSVTALHDAADRVIGCLLIGTDNTARKQVEAEQELLNQRLIENNVELAAAKNAAEKANLAKSEFLSSMSHELRTPLNAVLGFAQLLASATPPPTEAQKLSIDQILHAGWYLLKLINEILDLALIESRQISISLEPMSLGEVLQDCQAMIGPQAEHRGLEMTFPSFDSVVYVHADMTRLKQVMINLLSNAIKYNREGGRVEVEYTLLKRQVNGEDRVRIRVKDTGIGLSHEQLGQLFQPFNRLGQEIGSEEGTGIGLVVTKQLVELMGGSIDVESHAGVGSIFSVELTLAKAPALLADHETYIQAGGSTVSKEASSKRTVLYVEDNPANMTLVEQLINRRDDLTLITAIDAHLGIKLAQAQLPDVILMDINLPGLSGYGALKILNEDESTAHIPVMALSSNAMPNDIEMGLQAGFFRYLTKPIHVVKFMEALDVALVHAAEIAAKRKQLS